MTLMSWFTNSFTNSWSSLLYCIYFPMATSPWRLLHGDFPITTFPWRLSHDDFPMTTFPWQLSHDNFPMTTFPWRLPHDDFPMTTFLWRLPHGDFPMTTSPWRLSHDDFPMMTSPWRLSHDDFQMNSGITFINSSNKFPWFPVSLDKCDKQFRDYSLPKTFCKYFWQLSHAKYKAVAPIFWSRINLWGASGPLDFGVAQLL